MQPWTPLILIVTIARAVQGGSQPPPPGGAGWEREAKAAIEQNIAAFNAHDSRNYWGAYNYPLISVGADGRVTVRAATAKDAEELARTGQPDFAAAEKEGWAFSTLDRAEAVDVSASKVHFRVVFTRHRKDGTAYRSVPGLWVVTRQNGHWGIQIQSNLADQ